MRLPEILAQISSSPVTALTCIQGSDPLTCPLTGCWCQVSHLSSPGSELLLHLGVPHTCSLERLAQQGSATGVGTPAVLVTASML